MQTEAGRTDFDLGQIVGRGAGEPFGQTRGERYLNAGVQGDDDARHAALVAHRNGEAGLAQRRHARLGLVKLTLKNGHESLSIPRTTLPTCWPARP